MRVVVLGAKGMLGTALMKACAKAGIAATGLDRDEVDIVQYQDLAAKLPVSDWVINCAGFTNVDLAETEREAALSINCTGAANAARASAANGARLLHVSTDYVFDGTLTRPYREDDCPNPLNYYGSTKLAGEKAVQTGSAPWIIVRTQSLFGANGRHFVQAILNRLDAQDQPVKVVNDQISCPTYTVHLADAMLALLRCERLGYVHVSSSGSCSWYDFACAIAERTGRRGHVLPVSSSEYKAPARRPANSVLDKGRLADWTGRAMPSWQKALEHYLAEIGRH